MASSKALARTLSTAGRTVCSSPRLLHRSAVRQAVTSMQMPAMSPTMTEGGIASWKKKPGESFSAGDVLLEIETDKATIDVEAQDDGVLGKIVVPDGSKNVPIGKVIALLAEEGDDISNLEIPKEDEVPASKQASSPSESASHPPPPQSSPEPSTPPPSHSSEAISHSGPMFPSVYRLLAENNVTDASKIVGTGVRGMITKGDLLTFLGKASGPLGTFKQSPTPIEEGNKGLQKKESPKAAVLDGSALRQLIVSTMLQNSLKARSAPAPSAVDFDSIIADYLPSTPSTSTGKQTVPTPPPTKPSSNFLDGLI